MLLSSLDGAWSQMSTAKLLRLTKLAATAATGRTRLVKYIMAHPDFATAQDPHMPRAAQRLLRHAIEAGHPAILLPTCQGCGAERLLVKTLESGQRVCSLCEGRESARECSRCQQVRRIAKNLANESICSNCWRRDPASLQTCAYCGERRIVDRRTPEGPQCAKCAPGRQLPCAGCGKHGRITGYLLGGPRCLSCYNAIRKRLRPCPICGEKRILPHLDTRGRPAYSECTGQRPRFTCNECGQETILHGRRCYPCVRRERLHDLFTCSDGTSPAHLIPVRDLLLASGRERSLALWVNRSTSAAILRDLVEGDLELTHEALDAHPRAQAADAVRGLLTETGLLSERDERLRRYDMWAEDYLGQLPANQALTLGPFVRWHLTQDLRARARHSDLPDGPTDRAKTKVRVARQFLDFLSARETTLLEASQDMLDLYLVEHPRDKVPLTSFIGWALASHRTMRLVKPRHSSTLPSSAMAETDYRATLQRLKQDRTLAPRIRLTGLLIGLYGQQATNIALLKHHDIAERGDVLTLRLGDTPVILPPLLANLLSEVRSQSPYWATTRGDEWLFSSLTPGNHIDAGALSAELRRVGIQSVPLRCAALLNLSSQIPIRPICDLTGLSPAAATRWAEIAARAWNSYPTMRRDDTSPNATDWAQSSG